jgi:hypothetical protein
VISELTLIFSVLIYEVYADAVFLVTIYGHMLTFDFSCFNKNVKF